MSNFRSKLIRLAFENPEIRSDVLPVLLSREAAWAGGGYGGTLIPSNLSVGEGSKLVARGEELHGWDKYAQLVAEAYKRAPARSGAGVKAFAALREHIIAMFQRMQSRIKVEFTPDDPYESAEQMQREVRETGVLKIYSGASQAEAWGPEVNLMIRAVHDFAAHLGGNLDRKPRSFTLKGELQAYNKHLNLVGPQSKAAPALFTEIVGQVCFFRHFGTFPNQKVVTLDQFDYAHLGVVDGYKIVDGDLVK